MKILQELRAVQAKAVHPLREKYLLKVRELATGQDVDVNALAMEMSDLSIDEDQLQRHVAAMGSLLQAQAHIVAGQQAEKELKTLSVREQALLREKSKFLESWKQKWEPLRLEMQRLSRVQGLGIMMAGEAAEHEKELAE